MVHRKDVILPLLASLLFSASSMHDSENSGRMERWFAMAPPPQLRSRLRTQETVTATITATHVVSEIWLSSCVTHASNLPSCPKDEHREAARAQVKSAAPFEQNGYGLDPREKPRDAREEFRAVRPSGVEPILSTEPPHFPHLGIQGNARKFKVFSRPKDVPGEPQPSRPSLWEEIVGMAFPYKKNQAVSNLPSAPTPPLAPLAPSTDRVAEGIVTRTVTVTETTRIKGPKTVVSFSITGCLPSKLPFDLDLCEPKPAGDTQPRVPALKLTSNEWAPVAHPSPSSVAPLSMETSTATKLAPSNPEAPATNAEPYIPDGMKDASEKGDANGAGKPSPSEDSQSQESEQLIPATEEDGEASELGSGFIDARK